MTFHIITIFPKIFDSYFQEGIVSRALGFKKKIKIVVHDLREFTNDRHRTVDDRPYGGGAGMLLKPEPLIKAICKIKSKIRTKKSRSSKNKVKVILFSAKGKTYVQHDAGRLSECEHIIMICGRYEGVDERVLNFVDEEISIGNYVLTGGELGAMVLVDSITRLIPGVLGHGESNVDESHSVTGVLEYPHFTRPDVLKLTPAQKKHVVRSRKKGIALSVPGVLLSGNHGDVAKWRAERKGKWWN